MNLLCRIGLHDFKDWTKESSNKFKERTICSRLDCDVQKVRDVAIQKGNIVRHTLTDARAQVLDIGYADDGNTYQCRLENMQIVFFKQFEIELMLETS